jgi:m7GpppX diphosphatase
LKELSDRRVYNVLEHKKEADKIVYEDTNPETGFMILPDMKWDGKTLSALVCPGGKTDTIAPRS